MVRQRHGLRCPALHAGVIFQGKPKEEVPREARDLSVAECMLVCAYVDPQDRSG